MADGFSTSDSACVPHVAQPVRLAWRVLPTVGVRVPGSSGFTVIELMVVILVLAVLAMVAVPSFRTMIRTARVTSQVNDFVGTLALARNTAIKRGTTVTVCASDQSTGSTTSSSCSTSTWQIGWMVYVGSYTTTPAASTILKVHTHFAGSAGSTQNTLRGVDTNVTPNITYFGSFISFLPSGQVYMASGTNRGCFFLIDSVQSVVNVMQISKGGRIRPASMTLPASGTAIPCT
ncbi:MAG: GspH/FimT family pseudopilin [Magnetococcales bacterium]|nr:GspH/FimT family pseudopilin [Magnetococcales bacterium]